MQHFKGLSLTFAAPIEKACLSLWSRHSRSRNLHDASGLVEGVVMLSRANLSQTGPCVLYKHVFKSDPVYSF